MRVDDGGAGPGGRPPACRLPGDRGPRPGRGDRADEGPARCASARGAVELPPLLDV